MFTILRQQPSNSNYTSTARPRKAAISLAQRHSIYSENFNFSCFETNWNQLKHKNWLPICSLGIEVIENCRYYENVRSVCLYRSAACLLHATLQRLLNFCLCLYLFKKHCTNKTDNNTSSNDLYCVGWGVKLYSLTQSLTHVQYKTQLHRPLYIAKR